MTAIQFLVRPSEAFDGKLLEIVPLLDDVEMTQLAASYEADRAFDVVDGYAGIVPTAFGYGPLLDYYLGTPESEYWTKVGKVAVLGCQCGEVGCWPLYAQIVADESSVVWKSFEQPYRRSRDYSGLGPFTFERAAYESAVEYAIGVLTETELPQ